MKHKAKRVFFPRNRLAELLSRPGGKTRDEAVSEAVRCVESVRESSLEAIESAITAAETIACLAMKKKLTEAKLEDLLQHADRIVTLAGTFGHQLLESVAKSLCDLVASITWDDPRAGEAIGVHVLAMRLAAPSNTTISSAEARELLNSLSMVLAHRN